MFCILKLKLFTLVSLERKCSFFFSDYDPDIIVILNAKKIFIFIVCASEISIPIKLFFFHRKNMISKGIILSQRAVLSILIPCLQSNATCTCFILPRFIHVHVVCYDRALKQLAFVRLAFFRQHYSTQIIMFIS